MVVQLLFFGVLFPGTTIYIRKIAFLKVHFAKNKQISNNFNIMWFIFKKCNNKNFSHLFTNCEFTMYYVRYIPDIGLAVRVFANGPGDLGSIPGRVIPKTQKMVLDSSLLNTQHYKERIKGKVEQSREGVAPSPTPWCNSYRKGSLRVTLDYGHQLYLLCIIIIFLDKFFNSFYSNSVGFLVFFSLFQCFSCCMLHLSSGMYIIFLKF